LKKGNFETFEGFFFSLFVNLSFCRSVSKVQTSQSHTASQTEKGGFQISEVFCVCLYMFVSLTKGDISEALTTQGSCVKVQYLLRFSSFRTGRGGGGYLPKKHGSQSL
jgi:hypothetical protein